MPGSGGTSNLSMSHFIGAGLTLRSRLRHHRPKGRHANSSAPIGSVQARQPFQPALQAAKRQDVAVSQLPQAADASPLSDEGSPAAVAVPRAGPRSYPAATASGASSAASPSLRHALSRLPDSGVDSQRRSRDSAGFIGTGRHHAASAAQRPQLQVEPTELGIDDRRLEDDQRAPGAAVR
jgi:hypothetical protein